MTKRFGIVFMLLPFAAACSSGTSSVLPQSPTATATAQFAAPARLNQAHEPGADLRQTQSVPSAADLLYVGNSATNSITVYRHDAAEDSAPLHTIAGSQTGLDHPGQLSQDAQGNLYVANGAYLSPSAKPAILVFAHGANGNVAPIRRIAGALTGIHNVSAMTVDAATGKIFVDDVQSGGGGVIVSVSLLRFAPDANGNIAPYARSASSLSPALQLASDSTGQNLIEAHSTNEPNNTGLGIDILSKQFSTGANPAAPFTSIEAFSSTGIADDPATKTYLTTANGIYRLAERTTGNGTAEGQSSRLTPAAISVITSDTCGTQLALGYLRNIYVTHAKVSGCAADAIYVYAPDAAGNAAPLRILSGPATRLDAPYGVLVGR